MTASPEPYEYVVKAAPCKWSLNLSCVGVTPPREGHRYGRCHSCLGNGTRLLAETAVPVSKRSAHIGQTNRFGKHITVNAEVWVPVETREEQP